MAKSIISKLRGIVIIGTPFIAVAGVCLLLYYWNYPGFVRVGLAMSLVGTVCGVAMLVRGFKPDSF